MSMDTSLDQLTAETEALWFAEAERRLEELRSGKVQGIDADEAFRTARKTLTNSNNN